jgi:hypothetical protein
MVTITCITQRYPTVLATDGWGGGDPPVHSPHPSEEAQEEYASTGGQLHTRFRSP